MKKIWESVIILVVALGLIAGAVLTMAYFEARAWNRLTGGDATTWEAVFVRLRVDCNNRRP